MKLSRSSSFERLLKAFNSWSVMIQRTSSSTHFLYGPFNSFLSSFCCLNLSLSLCGRFSGSTVLWGSDGFGDVFGVVVADCAMSMDGRPNDKNRNRVD